MVTAGVAKGVGAGEAPAYGVVVAVAESHKPGVAIHQAACEADGELQALVFTVDHVTEAVILDGIQKRGGLCREHFDCAHLVAAADQIRLLKVGLVLDYFHPLRAEALAVAEVALKNKIRLHTPRITGRAQAGFNLNRVASSGNMYLSWVELPACKPKDQYLKMWLDPAFQTH